MAEPDLYQSSYAQVTPTVVRLGNTSYQVANITSVAIHHRRKVRGIALVLILAGLGVGTAATLAYPEYAELTLWGGLAAAALVAVGIVVQQVWPLNEYRFTLRMSNGESNGLILFDKAPIFELKAAIEKAFSPRENLTPPK